MRIGSAARQGLAYRTSLPHLHASGALQCMLTTEQKAARGNRLTASMCGPLMTGDREAIMRLWRQLRGEEPEPDLDWVWPVQLGTVTETLNLLWYVHVRPKALVTRQGEVVVHSNDLFACTLDGWGADIDGPVDAKHVSGRESIETVVERYTPQMTMQMLCTGATRSCLSIIAGAGEPVLEYIDLDRMYAMTLQQRGELFMASVRSGVPLFDMPEAGEMEPVKPISLRTVDMSRDNRWGDAGTDWLACREASVRAQRREKELKALMPPDARIAHGCGVRITRDRAGRLSLRVDEEG